MVKERIPSHKLWSLNPIPVSIFSALSEHRLTELYYSISEDGFKGLPKNRVAWYWQQQALLIFFSQPRFYVHDFDPAVIQVPYDNSAIRSIELIADFNKKHEIETSLYDPNFIFLNPRDHSNIKANIKDSNRILRFTYRKLKEYNYLYDSIPREFKNGWSHFYSIYHKQLYEDIEDIIHNLIVFQNKEAQLKFFSEHVFLNFLKILVLFSYSLNYPEGIMNYEELQEFKTPSFIYFAGATHRIYHNPEALMNQIYGAIPDIEQFITTCSVPPKFSSEYLKYYIGEISKDNLLELFNINEHTLRKWIEELDLPIKKQHYESSPLILYKTFREDYKKYCKREMTKKEIMEKFNINQKTFYEWRDELNLPILKNNQKESNNTTISAEPPIQQITSIKKHALYFNLFGYKLTIRNPFKVEKVKQPISAINLSDDFDDFIEY